MGINNVAITTFNSTGSHSLCRANEADSSKIIESQFLTKCTTEYINGSGISLIKGALENTTTETFNLPSDCDAISDIIYDGIDLTVISKIDVYIGQLKIQTIYPYDIISRNLTELGGQATLRDTVTGLGTTFSIPFIGRAKNKINSFLQAGAMTNKMNLKFTYISPQTGSRTLCVFSHQITDTEKNFISKNIINRVVHTSQALTTGTGSNVTPRIVLGGGEAPHRGGFDLDKIDNINVSHILIYSPMRVVGGGQGSWAQSSAPITDPANVNGATVPGSTGNVVTIKTTDAHGLQQGDYVEIFFSTTGVAGTGVAPTNNIYKVETSTPADNLFTITASATAIGNKTGSLMAIQQTGLQGAELVLGNDRTGFIGPNYNAAQLATQNNIETFSLSDWATGLYIIKLADSAFSTAGIPFSRVNNKKLKLIGVGTAYVTVCGTQVQTTVGGTISFSA